MPRPQIHSSDRMLDAARELVVESGAGAATVGGIARASGAPSGSIYHRFGSRDELLAQLWMRTARRSQARFLTALRSRSDPVDAAVAAALSIYDFAREETADARLLIMLRRQDLVRQASVGAGSRLELEDLNRPIEQAIDELTSRIYGSSTRTSMEVTLLAVVDLPYGAVRRVLLAGSEPPAALRAPLERAVRAVLTTKGRTNDVER